MKKTLMLAFVLLLAATVSAISLTGFITMLKESNYVPPEENLIIVETTPEGIAIEKRMAGEADLLFNRALKIKAIFGATGVTAYENEFILSLRNVSNRKLENISLIETIPKETVENPEKIESDENFTILETNPTIIKFTIKELVENETKKIAYRVQQKQKVAETAFKKMPIPAALIKIEEQTCIGMICNDFNPCTRDYCEKEECKSEPLEEGTACGTQMQCFQGQCVTIEKDENAAPAQTATIPQEPPTKMQEPIIILTIALALAITAGLLYYLQKK